MRTAAIHQLESQKTEYRNNFLTKAVIVVILRYIIFASISGATLWLGILWDNPFMCIFLTVGLPILASNSMDSLVEINGSMLDYKLFWKKTDEKIGKIVAYFFLTLIVLFFVGGIVGGIIALITDFKTTVAWLAFFAIPFASLKLIGILAMSFIEFSEQTVRELRKDRQLRKGRRRQPGKNGAETIQKSDNEAVGGGLIKLAVLGLAGYGIYRLATRKRRRERKENPPPSENQMEGLARDARSYLKYQKWNHLLGG